MTVKILQGDCLKILKEMESESVDCVVTSPPYWGLRDYGVDGQMGMEPTLAEHIAVMVKVFSEIKRVLKSTGTCWINYGDCYASSPNGRPADQIENDDRRFRDKPFSTVGPIYRPRIGEKDRRGKNSNGGNGPDKYHPGRVGAGGYLKPKDLCMIPNRLAIALQEDGWWVRSEIIWAKPNPMPESVTDRPAVSHEKIFLLTKSARYFYDAEAVRQPSNWDSSNAKTPDGRGADEGPHGSFHKKGREKGKKRGASRPHAGFNDKWDGMTKAEQASNGRNLRNVWSFATKPFRDAHFATFPPELPEMCIKAGTSEKGVCSECGAPWCRISEKSIIPTSKACRTSVLDERDIHADKIDQGSNRQKDGHIPGMVTRSKTVGWAPSCTCDANVKPAVVLDPFGGAGTTGLVADRLQRDAILIELNPEYSDITISRISKDAGMFAEIN